jgi:hypothetical protein
MGCIGRWLAATALAGAIALAGAPTAGAQKYGYLEFPRDEHQHVTGWDWWWGAAHVVTRSGHSYALGYDFDSYGGVGAASEELFPLDGPYKGLTVTSMDGSEGWGHPAQTPGEFRYQESAYLPGVSELLSWHTHDLFDGDRTIATLRRSTPASEAYDLQLDQAKARVHPTGQLITLKADLHADMKSPPLLAGGTGQWWYGLPKHLGGYPSRSFQYMQGARRLTGTLALQQPDGSVLHEDVVPEKSTMLLVHEYDASPEDLFAGLAVAETSQVHPRYAPYYQGGMPWELAFVDLDNGAQLMLAVLAFHDSKDGTLHDVTAPGMPTYEIDATLRLPDGRSVAIPDLHVEHLSYRHLAGIVPTFAVYVNGVWTQSWDYRVSYPGGTETAPDGTKVQVPPFDLGLTPEIGKDEPKLDDKGQGLTQRVPFDAAGSYAGCPVHGFAYTELIINWYGHEAEDPWFTGGSPPPVPDRCRDDLPRPPGGTAGNLSPPPDDRPLDAGTDPGCSIENPSQTESCSFDATMNGAATGYGANPGDWTVTITHPNDPTPLVITSFGGGQVYACGTIRPHDHVVVTAKPGATIGAGNPLATCF